MNKLSIKEITRIIDGNILKKDGSETISDIQYDSRMITAGGKNTLFFALRGERVNGHDFVASAFANGAKYAVVEKQPEALSTPTNLIFVGDTLNAIGKLCKYYRDQFKIPFIGITGSVGKTATKEFIANVLSNQFKTHRSKGNLNTLVGMPYSIFQLEKSQEVSVIEMGTNHFGEIKKLTKMLSPTFAVITNVGQSHTEFLENIEGVFREKVDLFNYSPARTLKIFNGDHPLFDKFKRKKGYKSFGKKTDNDYLIDKIEFEDDHYSFNLNDQSYSIFNDFRPNIYNAIPAIIIAEKFGLTSEKIKNGLMTPHKLDLRMEIIRDKEKDWLIIADCYNSNPMSLRSSLDYFAGLKNPSKIAVLGDMLELGTQSEKIHLQFGEYLKNGQIDHLITIGEQAKYFGGNVHYSTVEKALRDGKFDFPSNSAILIKGSRSIHLEKILERIIS